MDPVMRQLTAAFNELQAPTASPAEARARFADGAAALARLVTLPDVPWEDVPVRHALGSTLCRVYRPATGRDRPPIVYFHGGGFVLGSVEVFHPFTLTLAHALARPVWSVEYPLAPESRCRETVSIVDATVQALTALAGPVVLMGDSAGGTLAAVAAQLARDRGASLVRACVLYCPAPDLAARGGSLEVFGREFFPRAETLAWFLSCYLERPEDSLNPLASPARHPHLDHLPPTLVVSAEYDPLRDSAEAYARALAAAGTAVVARRWDGMPHDFVLFPGPHSRAVLEATRAYLDGVADR